MSLRGSNNGARTWALPAGYDATKDFSVYFRMKLAATADNSDRVLVIQGNGGAQGLVITHGGGVSWNGTSANLIAAIGDGTAGNMGVVTGASVVTGFKRMGGTNPSSSSWLGVGLAVRGTASPANDSGLAGAQQIANFWTGGSDTSTSVGDATTNGITTSTENGYALCGRVNSTSSYWNGWIADLVIWQDYLLTQTDIDALEAGADPSTIQSAKILVMRSLRSAETAEIGDTSAIYTSGTAPTIDTGKNPPAYTWSLSPAGAVQLQVAGAATVTPLGTISPDAAVQSQVAGAATLTAPATLSPAGAVQLQVAGSPTLGTGYDTPTVSRPAGGGDVDVASTTISSGTTAAPTINLFGDPETNVNAGTTWQTFWCAIDLHQTGRLPTITLDFSTWRNTTPPANNRLYWRAAGSGPAAWAPFDNRSVAGSILTVWNSASFDVAQIEVAFAPTWSLGEIQSWLTANDSSPYLHRPAACTALGISSSAPDKYAYYDFPDQVSPDGIQVGAVYAYAWLIRDDSTTRPGGKIRILMPWQHAGEWTGLVKLREFLDLLLTSSGADWVYLRQNCEFMVALQNTAGMVGGMGRGCCEPGDVGDDPNRVWWLSAASSSGISDPIASVDATINLAKTEWGTTGGGAVLDCAGIVSWHSQRSNAAFFCDYPGGIVSAASQYLHDRVVANYGGTLGDLGNDADVNSSARFAQDSTAGGLNFTAEWGYNVADVLAESASVPALAAALVETIEAGYVGAAVVPAGAVQLQVAGSPTLGADPVVAPAAAVQLQVAGSPALSWAGTLSPAGAVQLQVAGAATVSVGGALSPAGAVQLQVAGSPALSWSGTLSPAGAVQLQVAGVAVLGGVTSSLSPAGAVQLQVAGAPILTGPTSYTPSPLRTGRAIGSRTLRAA